MREHDSSRSSGGSRRVLDQSDSVGRDAWIPPLPRELAAQIIRGQPRQRAKRGQLVGEGPRETESGRRGEHDLGADVTGDAPQLRQGQLESGRMGRIHRHRHEARIQASEKRRDVLQPGRVQQQRTVPSPVPGLQLGCDGPRPGLELGVRQRDLLRLAVDQERADAEIGTLLCSVPEEVYPGGWPVANRRCVNLARCDHDTSPLRLRGHRSREVPRTAMAGRPRAVCRRPRMFVRMPGDSEVTP